MARPIRILLAVLVTLLAWSAPSAVLAGEVIDLESWRRTPKGTRRSTQGQRSRPRDNSALWTRGTPPRRPGTLAAMHPRDAVYHSFLDVTVPAQLRTLLGRGSKVESGPFHTCSIIDPGKNRHLRRLMEQYTDGPLRVSLVGGREPAETLSGVYGSWSEEPPLSKLVLAAAGAGFLAPAAGVLAWYSETPRNRTGFLPKHLLLPRRIGGHYAEHHATIHDAARLELPADPNDPLVTALTTNLIAMCMGSDDLSVLDRDLTSALSYLETAKAHAQAQQRQWQRYRQQRERGDKPPPEVKVEGCSPLAWSAKRADADHEPDGVRVTVGWVDFHFDRHALPETARAFVSLNDPYRNHHKGVNLTERGLADAVLGRIDALTSEFLFMQADVPMLAAASLELLMGLQHRSTSR